MFRIAFSLVFLVMIHRKEVLVISAYKKTVQQFIGERLKNEKATLKLLYFLWGTFLQLVANLVTEQQR